MQIDYNYLEDEDVNVKEYLNDLLSQKIEKMSTIEEADLILDTLMKTIEDLDSQIEMKKKKVNKELETALAISEINLGKKTTEKQEIADELKQLKEEYQKIKTQIK
ncbi:unnamed protein product [Paramecium pentaurelia]|uniref:Uncharacterized protein n=1 Tax=Paramecium pentaurelia TaxID=43138 RepID=A0A8S1S0K3_9CILI|nr:unnamed protein product [Paramecium pentaurelia]